MGALAGGALLLVPVLLKTHLKVDEVVTTLLLNFVVLLVVSYLIEGPWKDPMHLWAGRRRPRSSTRAYCRRCWPRGGLHLGLIIALIMAVLVWLMMRLHRTGLRNPGGGTQRQGGGVFRRARSTGL